PEEIQALAKGSFGEPRRRVVEKETSILLGEPAEYPHTLVEVLSRIFSAHPEVEAAYLAQFCDPASGEPTHPLVGVLGRGYEEALREAGRAVESISSAPVDFVRIDPAGGGLSSYFLDQAKPFYRRGASSG